MCSGKLGIANPSTRAWGRKGVRNCEPRVGAKYLGSGAIEVPPQPLYGGEVVEDAAVYNVS